MLPFSEYGPAIGFLWEPSYLGVTRNQQDFPKEEDSPWLPRTTS